MELVLKRMDEENHLFSMAARSASGDIILPLRDVNGQAVLLQFQLKNTGKVPTAAELEEEVEKSRVITSAHKDVLNVLIIICAAVEKKVWCRVE